MDIDIRITEVLSKIITINSSSVENAISIVKDKYKDEEFILDYSNYDGNVIFEEKINDFESKKDLLINQIIKYYIQDEKKHYEESKTPNNHIYLKLQELEQYIL